MGIPRDWRRPVVERIDQPRDDGRGYLDAQQGGNIAINGRPDIPHGIQRQIVDRSYGYIANDQISEWPPYDFGYTVMPHLIIARSVHVPLKATSWSTKSNFDDSIGVLSVPVGNPLG